MGLYKSIYLYSSNIDIWIIVLKDPAFSCAWNPRSKRTSPDKSPLIVFIEGEKAFIFQALTFDYLLLVWYNVVRK